MVGEAACAASTRRSFCSSLSSSKSTDTRSSPLLDNYCEQWFLPRGVFRRLGVCVCVCLPGLGFADLREQTWLPALLKLGITILPWSQYSSFALLRPFEASPRLRHHCKGSILSSFHPGGKESLQWFPKARSFKISAFPQAGSSQGSAPAEKDGSSKPALLGQLTVYACSTVGVAIGL